MVWEEAVITLTAPFPIPVRPVFPAGLMPADHACAALSNKPAACFRRLLGARLSMLFFRT